MITFDEFKIDKASQKSLSISLLGSTIGIINSKSVLKSQSFFNSILGFNDYSGFIKIDNYEPKIMRCNIKNQTFSIGNILPCNINLRKSLNLIAKKYCTNLAVDAVIHDLKLYEYLDEYPHKCRNLEDKLKLADVVLSDKNIWLLDLQLIEDDEFLRNVERVILARAKECGGLVLFIPNKNNDENFLKTVYNIYLD
jgi:hypothetical protein